MYKRSKSGDQVDRKLVNRLKNAVKKILSVIDASEIILFGSFARGEQKTDSSLDIMVIADTKLPFIERIKTIIRATLDEEPPVDPLVFTPDELRQKLEKMDSFIVSALSEGILLWSKSAKISIEDQLRWKKHESEYKELILESE